MRVEPLGDKVVVKRLAPEEKTAGGILLPDSAQGKPTEGKVLSVGEGRLTDSGNRVKPQVADGDRVIFSSWAGTEIDVDGEEVLILSESDILAIVQ
jgi:chaperonin GroES